MNMRNILLFILISFVSVSTYAQSSKNELLEEDIKDIKSQIQNKVWLFGEYIGEMAKSEHSKSDRLATKRKALNFFMHKGEGYQDINGKWHDGTIMEVSSVKSGITYPKFLKTYMEALINKNYPVVYLETTKVNMIEVGPLRHIRGNEYVCTAYFEQVFQATRKDGGELYGDRTKKSVTCHVLKKESEVIKVGQKKYHFVVFLGDIRVSETKPLYKK